jgi:hypothetical protein
MGWSLRRQDSRLTGSVNWAQWPQMAECQPTREAIERHAVNGPPEES